VLRTSSTPTLKLAYTAKMDTLTPTERRELRALAHHLEPVVTVGHHGLTPQVLHELDVALKAHELVKIRVLGDDRDAREAMLAQASAALDCAPVQHVGKVLVVWRPNPEMKKKAVAAEAPKARPARKPGPRKPVDAVRERRRKSGSEWGAAAPTGPGRRGEARHARPVANVPAAKYPATKASATRAPATKAPATPRRRTRGS